MDQLYGLGWKIHCMDERGLNISYYRHWFEGMDWGYWVKGREVGPSANHLGAGEVQNGVRVPSHIMEEVVAQ